MSVYQLPSSRATNLKSLAKIGIASKGFKETFSDITHGCALIGF
jgi:hypothetical protein